MKSKKSKQELTRLILTALILGGGCLYGPVAEAAKTVNVTTSNTPSNKPANADVNHYSYFNIDFLTVNSGSTYDVININCNDYSWNDYYFLGGYGSVTNGITYRTVNLLGGKVKEIYGGYGGVFGGGVSGQGAYNNTVKITGGTVTTAVYGGYSHNGGGASNNKVIIEGTDNLKLEDAAIYGGVTGGSSSGPANNNAIYINRSVDVKSITGGSGTANTGNKLYLGSTDITATNYVNNVDYVYIGYNDSDLGEHKVSFTPSTTVLSSDGSINIGTELNIIGLNRTNPTYGIMTLLSSGTANNFSNLKVTYGGLPTELVQFGSGTTSKEIDPGTSGGTAGGKGVTLNYNTYAHTLSLNSDANQVLYTVGNSAVKSVDLKAMTWNDGYTSSGFTFTGGASSSGGTSINASNLSFGKVSSLIKKDDTMALLSGATGLTTDNTITGGTGKTITIENYTDTHGIKFDGTATGNAEAAANGVNFKISGVTLGSIDLSGWKGAETNPGSEIPDTWTGTNVDVATGSFYSTPSDTTVIFSTNTPNTFNDNKITGAKAYKDGTELVDDSDKGVTLTGYMGGGVKATDNGKNLTYFATMMNTKNITFGDMAWGTGRVAGNDYNFGSLAETNPIVATNLKFTNPLAVGAVNSTMALLSEATDLAAGKTVTGSSHSQTFEDEAATNGVKLNGNITGTVSTAAKAVNYQVTGKSITGADLSGWDGTSYSLSGWTSNFGTGSITAAGFTAPDVKAGQSKDILTASNGFFSDDYITGSQKYGPLGTPSSDTEANVTFTGSQEKGVKASTDGTKLQYVAGNMAVSDITLGTMDVGTGGTVTKRTADANYTFDNNTKIDATSLKFNKPADVVDSTLVTSATGITTSNPVTGASHSQAITNAAMGAGITASGTLHGTVSAVDNGVNYAVTDKTVSSMDISNWDKSTETTTLPNAKWTGSNVSVTTGDLSSLTTDKTIFTTTKDGFFGNITGASAYKDGEAFSGDTANGVSLSGTLSGGVKATDNGKVLKFLAQLKTVKNVALGTVDWNNGGTARTLTGNYDFSTLGNNGVDATNLKFTFTGDGANTIKADDTMTLLAGATGLHADLTVKGSPVSQGVSYSLGNGTGLSGTLTGDVTTTTGTVNYKVTGKTLDSVNLSNWDGNNTDLDASWEKNTNGINVTGSGFTAPTAIGDTPILTAGSNDFFTNAIIADNIKFQPSGAYSETDSNITLSGSRGSGVKADDNDGSKLVYSIGAAFINNIKLGTVTYDTTGPWIDKSNINAYNFSTLTTLSSLDTALFAMSMTDAQKQSVAVGDTMTLVKGNNTLGNIAEKDAGASNYTYAPTTGMAVNGTVYGKVSASNNDVLYTVSDKKATTLDITNVTWGQTYNRSGSELDYQPAVVDSSNILFTGVSNLSTGDVMNLISNYGSGINKTRGGIFTLENGKTGKGTAYFEGGVLKYKVTLGAGEVQPAVSATNNKAILIIPDGQEHQGTVTGGEAKGDGDSTGNEQGVKGKIVTNTDGTGGDVNGGTSEEGDSKRNKADVEDSTIEGDVNGGKSDNGNSTDNEADVDNSTVHGDVNGGDTNGDGGTKGNRANVKHGSVVKGNVNGGHSGGNGDSTGNEANVGDSTVDHDVNGGYSEGSGNANENKTTVSGSTIGGGVNGGHSGTGSTNKNETTVSDSTVTGDVTGGRNEGDGTANENRTTVSGSNVGGDVIGGQSKNGNTNQNEVSVSGGSVGGEVIGGKTENGSSSNNNVTISGNTDVNGKVYGGYSENGSASGNTVTIKNASVRDYVYGGKSKSQSSNNSVLFEPGKALGIIGGGCEVSTNNTAELREGAVDEHVIGGFATATATSNTATVVGGTVTGSVIGGYGGTTAADNNTVNLGGGTVTGNTITSATLGVTIDGGVYGGYSVSGTTQNNTVNIFGSADVSNTGLFGGNLQYNGNVLNIGYNNTPWTGGGQSVKDIKNFESMNFSIVPWSTTQSGVTISNGGSSDLSMTTVSAKEVAFTGVKSLAVNDTMTLLDQSAVDGAKQATNVVENSKYTLGTVQEGTGTLTKDANGNVLYQVETASVSKQTHNTVMAAEAAMVSINAGNDFINSATDGLARDENMGKDGMATYAKIGGQSLEHETGSHVNVNTWNAILAVGHKNVKKKSTFEYGAFVEHGRGNFTTHNDGLRGDGSVDYTGGGLLAKWKTNNGTYVEGSFRAGTVNEKANNLLRDAVQAYGYDERTSYAGFHIGVGKETVLKNGNLVDVYGKYFYNRKNGMNFNAGFDEYNIDAVTSQILRVGARYTVKSGSRWNYYGDLSYEHEFDGKATGRVNDMAIRGADISGGSLRMELGASLTPNDESPWEVDFNLTAYAGNKSGFTGGVSVKYAF